MTPSSRPSASSIIVADTGTRPKTGASPLLRKQPLASHLRSSLWIWAAHTVTTRALATLPLILMLAAGLACSGEPDKVVFMAGFRAQANLPFAAAYVAQDKGYFQEQGLDVEIRHASSGEHLKLLLAGDVDFTTAAASSALKRRSDPGLPIVAFALFGQRGQQAYASLGASGITTPKEWEGRTFGYKISVPPDYLAILQANGVDRSKINEVKVGFDPRVLTEGKVDVLAVFNSNEPDTIRRLGFRVTTWEPESYGVPNLGLTYITSQDVVDEKPEVVRRFLKATMRAMEDITSNPEYAIDVVLKYAPGEDREHQMFMLKTELDDAISPLTEERGAAWMTDEQWRRLYDMLIEYEALAQPFDYKTAFTDRFLTDIYENGKLRWP